MAVVPHREMISIAPQREWSSGSRGRRLVGALGGFIEKTEMASGVLEVGREHHGPSLLFQSTLVNVTTTLLGKKPTAMPKAVS